MASPQQRRKNRGTNPRYAQQTPRQQTSSASPQSATRATTQPAAQPAEQYFSATPQSADVRHTVSVELRGHRVTAVVSHGVFSTSGLDKGTAVLLREAPTAPQTGEFLDLGCGWGPIALSLGLESPQAHVWAVDVNDRALELTRTNAQALGIPSITAVTAEALPQETTFDLIWSNPPIRIGKEPLHHLLLQYLPRLKANGRAYLVVQKHLGSDSLMTWLTGALGTDFSVNRYAMAKGFRIIEIARVAGAPGTAPSEPASSEPSTDTDITYISEEHISE